MTEVPKSDLGKHGRLGWQEDHERVSLRCPNGHIGTLDAHQIDQDGIVTPSVICPKCNWHDVVRLIGY